ncbi:iron-sulfur cluster assembly scaffold protein [bacterium]|nr:iron-sulfur cluster assembly scaffold protein [bacterium]
MTTYNNITEAWSDKALSMAREPLNLGEMLVYDAVSLLRGPCGDRMSIWIKLEGNVIDKISFMTDGCGATFAAGSAVTQLAKRCTIFKARSITPQAVINACNGLPASHLHCAILAVHTLNKTLDKL